MKYDITIFMKSQNRFIFKKVTHLFLLMSTVNSYNHCKPEFCNVPMYSSRNVIVQTHEVSESDV